jgi:uncharacterized membrane protein
MEPTQNQATTETTPESSTQATTNQTATPAQPTTTPATPAVENDTLMGVLCYLGPLVIIPYMTSLDNPFVKFHVKQGIVLFGLEVILYIAGAMFLFGGLYPIIMLLNLGTLILTIIGIVNVVGKKEVALPLIGQFADKVKI